jgi:hypothetical protein
MAGKPLVRWLEVITRLLPIPGREAGLLSKSARLMISRDLRRSRSLSPQFAREYVSQKVRECLQRAVDGRPLP